MLAWVPPPWIWPILAKKGYKIMEHSVTISILVKACNYLLYYYIIDVKVHSILKQCLVRSLFNKFWSANGWKNKLPKKLFLKFVPKFITKNNPKIIQKIIKKSSKNHQKNRPWNCWANCLEVAKKLPLILSMKKLLFSKLHLK